MKISNYLIVILLLLCLGSLFPTCLTKSRGSANVSDNKLYLKFATITGDTDSMACSGKMLLILYKDPACTGCKISLGEFLHNDSLPFPVLVLADAGISGIFNRKMYEKKIASDFPGLKVVYSLHPGELMFRLNDSIINPFSHASPELFFISRTTHSYSTRHIRYDELSDNTSLQIESLKRILGE